MNKKIEHGIGKDEFLKLPTEEICKIVKQNKKPKVGVFVADGNRRLIMCRTRLAPNSDEFYSEYAHFFASSLMQSLRIFFDHGLETLFFPLFGPSLLLRKNKFQSLTIPAAYREIFLSEKWFDFYKENDIRVKAYGNLSQLEKIDINHLNMEKGIQQTVEQTATHTKHTVFFGFMSENTSGLEMPQLIINFYNKHKRTPTSGELIEMYYGENIPGADFFLFSNKLSIRALPPLISIKDTRGYFLPVPGFLGFSISNYRKILYDFLFSYPQDSLPEYTNKSITNIENLEKFYQSQMNTIIGIEEKPCDLLSHKIITEDNLNTID